MVAHRVPICNTDFECCCTTSAHLTLLWCKELQFFNVSDPKLLPMKAKQNNTVLLYIGVTCTFTLHTSQALISHLPAAADYSRDLTHLPPRNICTLLQWPEHGNNTTRGQDRSWNICCW